MTASQIIDKGRRNIMSRIKNKEDFEKQDSFGIGAPNDAFAQYFTGNSFLKALLEG